MLVSTHNLGSVPDFCDQVVLINRTVLAAGPTAEVFTQANLERAFGGVLRHFQLGGDGAARRRRHARVTVLTDDERPLVFYGDDEASTPRRAEAKAPNDRVLMTELLVPFSYDYMVKAMWVSALVGGVCAFLSAYLMLKGWSLMGDALAHSIVPGVAGAYILGLPFAVGAFFAGILAALGMAFVKQHTRLREDAVIGLVFTSLFALGLLMASIWPTSVSVQTIVLGNILGISDEDVVQVAIIAAVSLAVLTLKWKDLMVTFFDESHARSIGLNTGAAEDRCSSRCSAPARWRRCRRSAPASSSPWW